MSLNNLDAYNEIEVALGGAGGHLNDLYATNAIAVLEGAAGGHLNTLDALNAIEVDGGGAGGHENTLDALNSIVVLKGGVGGHENDLGAINEWVDFAGVELPLDAVSGASLAYSTRRLRADYAGSAIRVRRSSDNAEQDIGFSANELDTVALLAFVGAGDGFVVTWFDQSENGDDLTQATDADQPQIADTGAVILRNTKPAVRFNDTSDALNVTVAGLALPLTIFGTITQITFVASRGFWDGITFRSIVLEQVTPSPAIRLRASGAVVIVPDLPLLTLGLITAVYNNPNDTGRLNDNSETTGDIVSLDPGGFNLGTTANFDGSEFIYYPSVLSAADQTTIRDNINAFFTIF